MLGRTATLAEALKERLEEANAECLETEEGIKDSSMQAVLVSTASVDALRRAYPNYFLDTQIFLRILGQIEKVAKGEPLERWESH